MDEIIKKIQDWNQRIYEKMDQESQTIEQKNNEIRKRKYKTYPIYKGLSILRNILYMDALKTEIKALQLSYYLWHKELLPIELCSYVNQKIQNLSNHIFSKTEYEEIFYCYRSLKALEKDLSWIKEKKDHDFTKEERERIKRRLEVFKDVESKLNFTFYITSIPTELKVNNNDLTLEHWNLISSYENYGDILRDCLAKGKEDYESYFFLVTILYSFKNYHFEEEKDQALEENPEYLLKRDPLNVLYFNSDDLEKIRLKLLTEKQDAITKETIQTIEDCILSRKKVKSWNK